MKPLKRKAKTGTHRKKRTTLQKNIASLAREGKKLEALQLARGWKMERDQARRLVDQLLAVIEMERNPKLAAHASFPDFYEQSLNRAIAGTWAVVYQAIKESDADFFERMAKRIREPGPIPDPLRVAVLRDMVSRDGGGKGKTAKEVAGPANAHSVRRLRREYEVKRTDK